MVRNLFGVLLALVGAAAAVWSPFRTWYGGRLGRGYRLDELLSPSGITGTQSGVWTGLFLPMLAAAVLTLLAVMMRSRLLVTLAGLLVLGFTILWMVRQGQDAGTLTAGAGGLGEGVGYAIGGGALLLMAALVMRGRRPRGRRRKGRKGRGRVDDSYAATGGAAAHEEDEYSEMPQPYGPFGTTHAPHSAYQADEGPPYGRSYDPYYDEQQTPPEEWDPWAAGRPGPGPGPGPEAPPPPADQPPQGPQQQGGQPPPPPGPEQGRGPHDSQRIPRRPDHRRGGPYR